MQILTKYRSLGSHVADLTPFLWPSRKYIREVVVVFMSLTIVSLHNIIKSVYHGDIGWFTYSVQTASHWLSGLTATQRMQSPAPSVTRSVNSFVASYSRTEESFDAE